MTNRKMLATLASTALAATVGCSLFSPQDQAPALKSPPAPFATKTAGVAELAVPAFTPEGIVCGAKALRWSASKPLELTLDEDVQASFPCRVQTAFSNWLPCLAFKVETDMATRAMTGRAEFPLNKTGAKGEFVQTVKLRDDGRAEITFSYNTPKEFQADFKNFIMGIYIPRHIAQGRTMSLGDKTYVFPADRVWGESDKMWDSIGGMKDGYVFNPQSPATGYAIEFPGKPPVSAHRSRTQVMMGSELRTPDGQLKVIVDFRDTPRSATLDDCVLGGINFTKCDDLDIPVHNPAGNLLMNPSFESGSRYWRSSAYGGFASNDDSMLCGADARFGKRSWRLGSLACVSIPVEPNQPYTFSFHAKPLDGATRNVDVKFSTYGKNNGKNANLKISGDGWRRYETTFTLPTSLVKITMSGKDVLLDGLQLEKGAKATAFSGNPFGLELVADSPDGLVLEAGKPFKSTLLLRGPAGAKGALDIGVTDFFSRERFKHSFNFDIPAGGEQAFALPLDAALDKGSFVLKAELKPEAGQAFTDYIRLTRFKYQDGARPNRGIQSSARYGYNKRLEDVPDSELELLRKIGAGQLTYYNSADLTQEDCDRLARHKLVMTNVVLLNGCSFSKQFVYNGVPLQDIAKSSPALESEVEAIAYRIAKEHPQVKSWILVSEPEGRFKTLKDQNFDDFARFLHAAFMGVKRGNPAAQVMGDAGPCNMGNEGRKSLENILAACNKLFPEMRFDGVGIHPYRKFPEQPDLDADTQALLAMLKAQGYGDDQPVNFNEFAYCFPLNVPAWDVAPWGWADHFSWMLTPSYDLGWGERVGAAMVLRNWLVCYKYMDRIKSATPWVPLLLDHQTPYAWTAMSSALGDILGDATFKEDIRFAPGARAYVFEDGQKRPVAVTWCWREALDRGQEDAPGMAINLKGVTPEFIDMMGNVCPVPHEGDIYTLPLSNYPLYIRGQAGELGALRSALAGAKLLQAEQLPLEFSAKLSSRDEAQVTVTNPLTNPFDGSVAVGVQPAKPLRLAGMGKAELPVKLSEPVSFDKIAKIVIPAEAQAGGKILKTVFDLNAFAVKHVAPGAFTIDADPADWKGIPAIKLGNLVGERAEGFQASYRLAWNQDSLYVLIEVTDDKFIVDHENPSPSAWYDNDAVQIFVDPFGDAPEKAKLNSLGYDDNDFSYELLPLDAKSAVVYRRQAPNQQLTGGLAGLKENVLESNVKIAFRQEGDKQVYEVEFPARYLMPLPLEAGTSAGIAFAVFDRDSMKDKAKQVLTNTPAGAAFPFRRPDVYPSMLLVK